MKSASFFTDNKKKNRIKGCLSLLALTQVLCAAPIDPFVHHQLDYVETISYAETGDPVITQTDSVKSSVLDDGALTVSLGYRSSTYDEQGRLTRNYFDIASTTWKFEETHLQTYDYESKSLRDSTNLVTNIGMGPAGSGKVTDTTKYYNDDLLIDSMRIFQRSAKYPNIVCDTIRVAYNRSYNSDGMIVSTEVTIAGRSEVEEHQASDVIVTTHEIDTVKVQSVSYKHSQEFGHYTIVSEKIVEPELPDAGTYVWTARRWEDNHSLQKIDLQADTIVEFTETMHDEDGYRKITYETGILDTIVDFITYYNADSTIDRIEHYKNSNSDVPVLDKTIKYYYKDDTTPNITTEKLSKKSVSIHSLQKMLNVAVPANALGTHTSLSIVDSKGRIVKKENLLSVHNTIALQDISHGVYMGLVEGNNYKQSFKIRVSN